MARKNPVNVNPPANDSPELEALARQLERQGLAAVGAAIDLRKGDITPLVAKRRLVRACRDTQKFIASICP